MATLSQLQTEVAEEIGSINTTDDATKINRWLNRGVRDFLRRTHCFIQHEEFTPGANENYTLDATILEVVDMYFTASGNDYSLERVTVPELLRLRRASTTTSTPARYYAFQNPLVLFYPTPGASDTLTVVNVPSPTEMSGASDDPSTATYGGIPVDYHDAIATYACWHLASFDDDQSSAQGQRYRDWYMERVKDARRELRLKGGHRMAPARVNPRGRRRFLSADPSTDLGY